MKKIFAAILAVFMIFAGLSIRGREDRLEPMERSESGGCVRVDTLLSAETVISRLAARELCGKRWAALRSTMRTAISFADTR